MNRDFAQQIADFACGGQWDLAQDASGFWAMAFLKELDAFSVSGRIAFHEEQRPIRSW